MKSASGRELAQAIERKGWVLLRIHGSHHMYGKEGSIVRLSVPIHGDRPLKMSAAASHEDGRDFGRGSPGHPLILRRKGHLSARPTKRSLLPTAPTVCVGPGHPAGSGCPGTRPAVGRGQSLQLICHLGTAKGQELTDRQSSSGNSLSSASENTGPSTHTYLGPTLQRPQMPMPHFMRFSSVV